MIQKSLVHTNVVEQSSRSSPMIHHFLSPMWTVHSGKILRRGRREIHPNISAVSVVPSLTAFPNQPWPWPRKHERNPIASSAKRKTKPSFRARGRSSFLYKPQLPYFTSYCHPIQSSERVQCADGEQSLTDWSIYDTIIISSGPFNCSFATKGGSDVEMSRNHTDSSNADSHSSNFNSCPESQA